jgi:putative copper resistance protein D
MATLSSAMRANPTSGFLDRYVLPKVALTVIAFASLVGVYLTMSTHGTPPAWALIRWLHLAALGVLAGGLMWWGLFMNRPDDPQEVDSVARFARAQQNRFRAIAWGAWGVALVSASHLFRLADLAQAAGAYALWGANTLLLVVALLTVGWLLANPPTTHRPFDVQGVRLALGMVVLTLASTAVLDARLTFPGQTWPWALRLLHVVAFGLWTGGAVWNIFVAVPGAQQTLAMPVVIAAAEQLERFRWAVRVILPTLLVTGLAQALPYTGLRPAALLTPFGLLILTKIGLVVALFIIFITCPMWRACSAIRGMCDLKELKAPPLPQPGQRIDNRGKACAGFVRIQRALDAMQPSDTLELLSTDRISWWELPAWLEINGHTLLQQEKRGRLWWRHYHFLSRTAAA